MEARQKAQELVNKFMQLDSRGDGWPQGLHKDSAMIVVQELIQFTPSINSMPPNCQIIDEYSSEYWEQVKNALFII